MPNVSILVKALADSQESIPDLCALLEQEWPAWYGTHGPGNVHDDLSGYSNVDGPPLGFVGFLGGRLCGFAALKSDAISGYEHLQPWAGSVVVRPELRNRGIGSQLVRTLEQEARRLSYKRIFAGTHRAARLLRCRGWRHIGDASQNGEGVSVYEKIL